MLNEGKTAEYKKCFATKIKQKLEKWAVATLYNQGFNQHHGRINKKRRIIIFDTFCGGLFKSFGSPKEHLAISVLINWYGYKCNEYNVLIPFAKTPPKRLKHTWGEVQDIIRSYSEIPMLPIKPISAK